MGIFQKRPLAAACLGLIAAVAGSLVLPALWCMTAGILTAVFLIVFLFVMRKKPIRLHTEIYLILLLSFILLGLFRGVLDRVLYENPLKEKMGENESMTLTVEDAFYRTDYGSAYLVKVKDGTKGPQKGALLLAEDGELQTGDVLAGKWDIQPLSAECENRGEEFRYRAVGCRALLASGEWRIVEKDTMPIRAFFSTLRERLVERLSSLIKGEEGHLVAAMLLGADETLDRATVRDFRRVGVSHLLALSGLHVGMVFGFFNWILCKCYVRREWRYPLILPLLFFYLLLTGSGFSMVRAFFMLAIPALFFYLKSQGDALTDLMFIGAAIVLVSPFAIFSISYQMTMLATFGILAFEKARVSLCSLISLKNGRFLPFRHFVRGILTSVSVTLSASVAVLPVQWLVFGEISTLGMFANLLLVPMASLLLSFSLPLLILPFRILAVPAGTVAFLMLRMVEWAADFHSVFSLGYTFVPFVLIPFFAVMTVLLLVRVRRRAALVYLPAVLAAVALTVCFQVHGMLTRNTMDTVYCVSGDSESLILSSAGRFALVDVTNGSKRQMRLAYQTLAAHGGTEIEYLVMTHYRNAHASTLSAFTSSYKVRRIYFPVPQNKEEENIYRAVYEMCEEKGIVLKKYDGNGEDELHFFRDVTAVFSPPLYENRSKRPALSFRISCGEGSVYYESAVCSEYRENLGVSETERKGTVLLLGVHGPVPHAEILVEGQFSAVYAANEKIAALTAEKQPPVVAKEVAFLIK